jgi:cation transport regulator ChaC
MYLFTYGSLMWPESLLRTIPSVKLDKCVPSRLYGYRRNFGVAFPNDGSQQDKAYFYASGQRPPVVLFADLYRIPQGFVNGIVLQVSPDELLRLSRRELRYQLVELDTDVVPLISGRNRLDQVHTFVSLPEFVYSIERHDGIVPHDYEASMLKGGEFWDRRVPGFLAEVRATTDWEDPGRVVSLRRVDYAL